MRCYQFTENVQLLSTEHSVSYILPTCVWSQGIFVANMGIHLT